MKKQGFTLIEFLISFSLLTLLILGTAQLMIFSLEAKKRADFHLAAAALASAKLEDFKSLSFESKELSPGRFLEAIPDMNSKENYFREWIISDAATNLRRIELEIYKQDNPRRRVRFVLHISKELRF